MELDDSDNLIAMKEAFIKGGEDWCGRNSYFFEVKSLWN